MFVCWQQLMGQVEFVENATDEVIRERTEFAVLVAFLVGANGIEGSKVVRNSRS